MAQIFSQVAEDKEMALEALSLEAVPLHLSLTCIAQRIYKLSFTVSRYAIVVSNGYLANGITTRIAQRICATNAKR